MADTKSITLKNCTGCKESLILDKFSLDKRSSDGRQPKCRSCCNKAKKLKYYSNVELTRSKQRAYNKANPEIIKKSNAKSRIVNSEKIKQRKRNDYLKNKDDPAFKQKRKKYAESKKEEKRIYDIAYRRKNADKIASKEPWAKKNPEKANAIKKKHYHNKIKNNPAFSLAIRLRSRIYIALKSKSYPKTKRTIDMLGCSYSEFQKHIEKQFTNGMSWERLDEIHIDHIIPLATAKSESDVIRLNHFTNLRPLWAKDNLSKGSKQLFLC